MAKSAHAGKPGEVPEKAASAKFDDAGNIVAKITESSAPEGMTEDKFFAKPILTKEDLAAALT